MTRLNELYYTRPHPENTSKNIAIPINWQGAYHMANILELLTASPFVTNKTLMPARVDTLIRNSPHIEQAFPNEPQPYKALHNLVLDVREQLIEEGRASLTSVPRTIQHTLARCYGACDLYNLSYNQVIATLWCNIEDILLQGYTDWLTATCIPRVMKTKDWRGHVEYILLRDDGRRGRDIYLCNVLDGFEPVWQAFRNRHSKEVYNVMENVVTQVVNRTLEKESIIVPRRSNSEYENTIARMAYYIRQSALSYAARGLGVPSAQFMTNKLQRAKQIYLQPLIDSIKAQQAQQASSSN